MNSSNSTLKVFPLQNWVAVSVEGDDAGEFLQGQLTQDVTGMSPGGPARWVGYCSPKGRLLSTAVCWRAAPQQWLLLGPKGALLPAIQRLRMFVLRSKVTFKQEPNPVQAWMSGPWADLERSVAGTFSSAPSALKHRPDSWREARQQDLALANEGTAMGPVWPLSAQDADASLGGGPLISLAAGQLGALGLLMSHPEVAGSEHSGAPSRWQAGLIAAGLATIDEEGRDRWVPQMIHWEQIGGVSFQKGCYPGQEVVARSQFRGAVKRRMVRMSGRLGDTAPAWRAGMPVFHSLSPEEEQGAVVSAVAVSPSEQWCLVEVREQMLSEGAWTLGGTQATAHGVPYELYDDV